MIAFLISELDIRGGTHKQFLKLIQYTERQNEEFCIITSNVDFTKTFPDFKKYKDQIRIFNQDKLAGKNIFSRIISYYRNLRKLKKLLAGVTVANIHDPYCVRYFNAFKHIPTYWQVNDLPAAFHVGVSKHNPDTLKRKLYRYLLLNKLKYINGITVNVTKNAKRIRKCFNRDAKVLYCGIEPLNLKHNIDSSFSRFENKKINLLSSGVWFPYRNYETQVAAIDLLAKKGYDVHLDIIGDTRYSPEYVKDIQSRINELDLSDRITIHGMVDESTFKNLHENADIFLFINIDQSWGLAVFEAMSCGLPVIVSNSVGATEILNDGKDSIFVNPTNIESVVSSILQLTTDKNLYTNISNTASKFCNGYTWDNAYSSPMLSIIKSGTFF